MTASTRSRLSPSFVIPADAGIQATLWSFTEANLDAGMRRHDETSLRLKARDFNHPERDINLIWFVRLDVRLTEPDIRRFAFVPPL